MHFWSLTAIAVASGVAMLVVFSRFSDQKRIRLVKRKIRAHLYEFRLFADEPALMFRAQKGLLVWNARYLGLMLRPTAVIVLPMVLLLIHLDAVYGHRPLRTDEQAIVGVELAGVNLSEVLPTLSGRGVAVETPAVRVPDRDEVYWRIRAKDPNGGSLLLRASGESIEKKIQAGAGLQYVSERRVSRFLNWLRFPAEPRLPNGKVRDIEVEYPTANVRILGFGVHWMIWFFVMSSLTMLALKKRFHVSF